MSALALALLLAASPESLAERALREVPAHVGADRYQVVSFDSPDLAANVQGNDAQAHVGVRLPKRYAECQSGSATCWLVLLLPGFDGSPEGNRTWLVPALAQLDDSDTTPPLVVLIPDGRTKLGGGFYVDSPASGRWEAMLMGALLPAAKAALLPSLTPEHTLVVGHSMGGFGALWLASEHPQAFGGAAALNPVTRPEVSVQRVMTKLEAAGKPLDPEELIAHPSEHRFFERVAWAECSAFEPGGKSPEGFPFPVDREKHPWVLTPSAQRALERFDIDERAAKLGAVPRVLVFGGLADPLIPPDDLRALDAARKTAGVGDAHFQLSFSEGDHLNHVAPDLQTALRQLTR